MWLSKLLWRKKGETWRLWPEPKVLAETDYDGNGLWARAFPKPEPLRPYEILHYLQQSSGMQNSFNLAQQSAQGQYGALCSMFDLRNPFLIN